MSKINVLLMGPIGTGKTFSCKTLLDAGKELFIVATEPGIESIMGDTDPEKVHWNYVPTAVTEWDTLIQSAEATNKYGMDTLQKMQSPNKADYMQFVEVYRVLANYTCQRTGKEYGPVDEWDDSRALVMDGLSGLSRMAKQLTVGTKPIITQPEWGVMQGNLMNLLEKLIGDTKCTFVLISHVDRQVDAITGGTHITIDTLGRALNSQIPKPFDEVMCTKRDGGKFYWSTTEGNYDLKARKLPFSDELDPTFVQLFEGETG
jgi:hypothetical protein